MWEWVPKKCELLSLENGLHPYLMRIFRRDLGAIARPEGVERAGLVGSLVSVGAEKVALALDDSGGQPVGTQSVVVRQ